jgi:hypothetical protein
METTPDHKRSLKLGTAALAVALATAFAPAAASARSDSADGVRAHLDHGTLTVRATERSDTIALRQAPNDPGHAEVDIDADGTAQLTLSLKGVSALDLELGNGDDTAIVDDSNGSLTGAVPTTTAGGPGDDTLRGGLGAEAFRGGSGDDLVIGGRADDSAVLGQGDDTFVWNPGDANDTISGQPGTDTMLFNGANASESVSLSADGGRLRFDRDVASVTMLTDGVEVVDFNALGGADRVTVNDLSGTDVRQTNLDLAGLLGGSAADGALDDVVVSGTEGDDRIAITGTGSGAEVTGLSSAVSVSHPDPTDRLEVETLGGDDQVTANGVAGVLQVLVDGVAL